MFDGLFVVADDAVEITEVVVADGIVFADGECSSVAIFGLVEFPQVFVAGSDVAVCFEVILVANGGL